MNLGDFLTEKNVRFVAGGEHRHVREGWIGVDCPRCGTVGKFHLGIHEQTLAANCWRCGRLSSGEVFSQLLGVSVHQAWGMLTEVSRTSTVKKTRVRGRLELPKTVGPLLTKHRQYLKRRRFDPDALIRIWSIRGIGLSSELSWRIWIPVHLDGLLATWTTRTIGDKARRYVHAKPSQEDVPIKTLLYGWDYVRHSIVVCEGPTDVWRIGPGAVALFGTGATREQIERIGSVPSRLICFDRGSAERRAASKLAESLSLFPGTTEVAHLDSSDPGEASVEELAELRRFLET